MNRLKVAVTGVVIAAALIVASCGSDTGGDGGTSNDVVLSPGGFKEYFRVEADGTKNYIYTVTTFVDEHGRECTVVTGNREQTVALDCD